MSKRVIKVTANELVDGNVSFISLVKRGANRLPFRILKEDETMKANVDGTMSLDLGKLFRKADAGTVLQAIAVVSAKADAVAEKLGGKGITIIAKHHDEQNDVTLLQVAEDMDLSGNIVSMKVDDDSALLVSAPRRKGFSSYVYSEDATFGDAAGAAGFFPSMSAAMSVLADKVYDAMGSSESPAAAATAIEGLITDFSKYAKDLVASLPVVAFKAYDALKSEDAPAAAGDASEELEVPGDTDTGDAAAASDEGVDDAAADVDADTVDTDTVGDEDPAAADAGEQVTTAKSDEPTATEAMLAAINSLTETVQGLGSQMTTLKQELTTVSTSVSKMKQDMESEIADIAERSERAVAAVKGTVLGDAHDQPEVTRSKTERGAVATRGVQLPVGVEVV